MVFKTAFLAGNFCAVPKDEQPVIIKAINNERIRQSIDSLGNVVHNTTYYRILYPAVSCVEANSVCRVPQHKKWSSRNSVYFRSSQIVDSIYNNFSWLQKFLIEGRTSLGDVVRIVPYWFTAMHCCSNWIVVCSNFEH